MRGSKSWIPIGCLCLGFTLAVCTPEIHQSRWVSTKINSNSSLMTPRKDYSNLINCKQLVVKDVSFENERSSVRTGSMNNQEKSIKRGEEKYYYNSINNSIYKKFFVQSSNSSKENLPEYTKQFNSKRRRKNMIPTAQNTILKTLAQKSINVKNVVVKVVKTEGLKHMKESGNDNYVQEQMRKVNERVLKVKKTRYINRKWAWKQPALVKRETRSKRMAGHSSQASQDDNREEGVERRNQRRNQRKQRVKSRRMNMRNNQENEDLMIRHSARYKRAAAQTNRGHVKSKKQEGKEHRREKSKLAESQRRQHPKGVSKAEQNRKRGSSNGRSHKEGGANRNAHHEKRPSKDSRRRSTTVKHRTQKSSNRNARNTVRTRKSSKTGENRRRPQRENRSSQNGRSSNRSATERTARRMTTHAARTTRRSTRRGQATRQSYENGNTRNNRYEIIGGKYGNTGSRAKSKSVYKNGRYESFGAAKAQSSLYGASGGAVIKKKS